MIKKIMIMLCICAQGAFAQQNQRPFSCEPEPLAGQPATIYYNNALTGLASGGAITGVIYLCDGRDWVVDDLDMTENDGAWSATYVMPEDCVLMACKFYGDDGEWDSGPLMGQYGIFVNAMVDGEPKPQQGAFFNWGLLRSKSLDSYAISGFCKEEAKIDDNVFQQLWVVNEMRRFPSSREMMCYFAAKILDKAAPGKYNHLFQQDIDYVMGLESPAEISLIRVVDTYRNMMKEEEKAAEVEAVILERFPDGILARDKAIWGVYLERDIDAKRAALRELVKRFPIGRFPAPETDISQNFYTRIFWPVMEDRVVNHKDYSLLYEIIEKVPYPVLSECYYRMVQLQLKHGLATYEEIRPHADAVWGEIMKRAVRGEDRYYNTHKRFSPRQWEKEVRWASRGYAITQAKVLYETGAYAVGLELAESVKDYFRDTVSDFNDTYAKLLAANGYDQLVVPFIEKCIAHDAATPDMLATLGQNFRKADPQGDFDAYVNGLRSEEHVAEFEEKLLASLTDLEIEPFVLEGMDGTTVDMAKLKGKVIVLDFWALWCSPCKAAMPGMQMAVNRYKDNRDVAFYFISTNESDKDYKTSIPKFIADHNYTFDVLYDAVDGNGRQSVYYNKYRINGIPHKMIIDRKGRLRWSSNGYFGNPQELASEISFIVDHLLSEAD